MGKINRQGGIVTVTISPDDLFSTELGTDVMFMQAAVQQHIGDLAFAIAQKRLPQYVNDLSGPVKVECIKGQLVATIYQSLDQAAPLDLEQLPMSEAGE